ncbi:hypothetical protein FACS1894199_05670 [Bacteroidia bacterium]|nr:hypothetical protein FACS1894199_05670 [Bacteroidia bacterium]
MGLLQNTFIGLRYRHWTLLETVAYFAKGVSREWRIAPQFFQNLYVKAEYKGRTKRGIAIKKRWLKHDGNKFVFDINGVILPDISNETDTLCGLAHCFEDTFLFYINLNDNYDKELVRRYDLRMTEGPYGYTDGAFDVTVKKGDVVIDAGSWIGDFSAYAAAKGAIAYAFEPMKDIYSWLCKTKELNNVKLGGVKIYPIQQGLGDTEGEFDIFVNDSGGASLGINRKQGMKEKISITTLDKFAEENKLEKIDFIKADIEGAERDMLRGAANVLKTFAPKLAICTYHLPDDPEVLEKIILEANPAYKVVHLRHKLMAMVVKN